MKKNKNKSKKGSFNIKKTLLIAIIVIAILSGIYFFLNVKDDETNLTILEKQWIMRNKKTLIDINVPNNLSILADNGEGVIFDYLKKVEKDTGLKFNKVSYNYKTNNETLKDLSIVVLSNEDSISNDDILLAEDNYVLVSLSDNHLSNLNDLYGKKIGIFKEDKEKLFKYVNSSYDYQEFTNIADLISSIKNRKVNYAIVPRYYILKDIVKERIYVNYSFNDMSNKIVLRSGSDNRLSSVMSKYLLSFKENDYMKSYEDTFMKFYINNTNATDLDTSSLASKIFTYGYVKDNTYNILKGKELYGFAGEYINLLSNMADIELDYKGYSSREELSAAIKSGNVDIAFINFDYKNEQGLYTINAFSPEMVAISKTNYRISHKEGLESRKLYTLKNTYLEDYLKDNYNSYLKGIKNIDKKIDDDGVLVLDELDYHYYSRKAKFDDYYLLLKDEYSAPFKFYIKTDEKVMYDYINFMLMYTDSNDIKTNSINKLVSLDTNTSGFMNMYSAIALFIIIPVLLLFIILGLTRIRKSRNTTRKEDILKYNDMLTSLKNRNYLNAHIEEWDEQKITPRTIIIIDLNNLKYINDNYGGEEGDLLIKKAAAILINTQLEKSEIVRTDGNEFLIYLVGYNEKQVNTYINKLSREFEKLPHGFGAAVGYSMIEDEIKTIDDAINEAGIEMRADKEQNYK